METVLDNGFAWGSEWFGLRGESTGHKEKKMAKKKTSLGTALGFITLVTTRVMAAIKEGGEEVVLSLSEDKLRELADQFAQSLVKAGSVVASTAISVFTIFVGGKRTTEEVVVSGGYNYANSWIATAYFPWRLRRGNRKIVLIDMREHGFAERYYLADALMVIQKLGFRRPDYEDGLLFGEQHPDEQCNAPIMFPHELILVARHDPLVVCLLRDDGERGLGLYFVDIAWDSDVRVAAVCE